MRTEIKQSKKELDELITRFDTFEIDEKRFGDIKQSVGVLKTSFDQIIEDYECSLIGGKEYTFGFKEVIKVSSNRNQQYGLA